MSKWTPERQVRYERARKAGSLGWRCLLCRRELRSDSCPHSLVEHEQAVEECRIIDISRKGLTR